MRAVVLLAFDIILLAFNSSSDLIFVPIFSLVATVRSLVLYDVDAFVSQICIHAHQISFGFAFAFAFAFAFVFTIVFIFPIDIVFSIVSGWIRWAVEEGQQEVGVLAVADDEGLLNIFECEWAWACV